MLKKRLFDKNIQPGPLNSENLVRFLGTKRAKRKNRPKKD